MHTQLSYGCLWFKRCDHFPRPHLPDNCLTRLYKVLPSAYFVCVCVCVCVLCVCVCVCVYHLSYTHTHTHTQDRNGWFHLCLDGVEKISTSRRWNTCSANKQSELRTLSCACGRKLRRQGDLTRHQHFCVMPS